MMYPLSSLLVVCCGYFLTPWVNGGDYSDIKSLSDTLLASSRYRTDIRPIENQSLQMPIMASFKLVSIVEINDVSQSFVCNGFLPLTWTDEVLQWDPSTNGFITTIHPLPKDIWRPRMVLLNTVDKRDLFEDIPSPVTIGASGEILWAPGGLFKASCDLDLRKYPFDEQTCSLKMLPMGYEVPELIFIPGDIGLDFFSVNGEWELKSTNISTSVSYVEQIQLSTLEITFVLVRRPTFFVLNILLPVAFLSLLNMLVFTIPAESGEKVSYGITVVLAMSVFLSIVSGMLPKSSDKIPSVTIYLFILLIVSVLTVIDAIIIVFFHNQEEREEKSKSIRRQYSTVTNKISAVRRALQGLRVTKKVSPPENGTSGKPLESAMVQIRRSPEVQEEHLVVAEQAKGCAERPKVNKYKIIGKYIDAISLVVFLIVWVIITMWYFITVLT